MLTFDILWYLPIQPCRERKQWNMAGSVRATDVCLVFLGAGAVVALQTLEETRRKVLGAAVAPISHLVDWEPIAAFYFAARIP